MALGDSASREPPAQFENGFGEPAAPVEPPGRGPLALAALAVGLLLMAIQLWLLTVALELFLSGRGTDVWPLAVISGFIFAGGLAMLWLLRRRPRVGPRLTEVALRELV
jgi:hypothetical protein